MRIILGADHGGFRYKEIVREALTTEDVEVIDVGAYEENPDDDFVDYAKEAVSKYAEGDKIVLFCRNGFGMNIVANRNKGVRCGIAFSKEAVVKGRTDDDINCLSIPSDYVTEAELIEFVNAFLKTEFSADPRYSRRINKIDI